MDIKALAALDTLPRTELVEGPTPIQRLQRIEAALGLADRNIQLYAKRDDVMPLGGGGNKLRKLEYHLGAALADGVDTIISVGGVQSNHARLTAAASAKLGLACELILARMVPRDGDDYEKNGNVLLDDLFGARPLILATGENALDHALARADELRARGRKVMVIPVGGSTPRGVLGYARCAREIAGQEESMGVQFDRIAVANGSSGTHAGLIAGLAAMRRDPRTAKAYAVLAPAEKARETTRDLANAALGLLGTDATVDLAHVEVDGSQLGDGYGVTTDAMLEAVRLMASQEGVLLDPVYTGKAFAGLLQDLRSGAVAKGERVLFVVTGGTPGLYAYRQAFS
ncbi:D-cysteine desulfhydrase family protein [Luteibacter sp.]|uniref:D-cysteine desulfhydrase family protein n=1 Tax=Luteibacter sp. TaxID=1886636 RepID=UPI003F818CC0